MATSAQRHPGPPVPHDRPWPRPQPQDRRHTPHPARPELLAADGLWLEAVVAYEGHTYTPHISIGANCNLSSYVHIACTNRVTIGDGLLCGSGVILSDHAHGQYRGPGQTGPETRPAQRRLSNDGAVVVGRNVWLGDGVAVLAGAEIGDGAVIGANSVVNGPIPPNTIAVGCPARVVRRWDGTAWVRLSPSPDSSTPPEA